MPEQFKNILIRHIAVALDCSPQSMASLSAAAELARMTDADLTGIFVEDINLLRMAELPFTHEIRIYTPEPEKIDLSRLERSLKLQAREAEEALERIAGQLMVRHTFRVCRGMVPAEVTAASVEADLLVLGRSGRSPSCRKGLGSTARWALSESAKHILFMRTGFRQEQESVLVLYDGSKASKTALGIAESLVHKGNTLHILLLPQADGDENMLEKEVSGLIPSDMLRVEFHFLPPDVTDSKILARYIRMAGSGLLVLSDHMNIPTETVHSLVCDIDYPVLLVRR